MGSENTSISTIEKHPEKKPIFAPANNAKLL